MPLLLNENRSLKSFMYNDPENTQSCCGHFSGLLHFLQCQLHGTMLLLLVNLKKLIEIVVENVRLEPIRIYPCI